MEVIDAKAINLVTILNLLYVFTKITKLFMTFHHCEHVTTLYSKTILRINYEYNVVATVPLY